MESRHMDVLEMDAASHTGVDDVRQINDSVRYAPASARYKVYIIDEVHMLSTAAFNAFLKTLEEPPEHAKFVFATTEIRKVPVTVLSRCQRFDLRRVDADVLMAHLANIAGKENVEVEPEALGIIARAAEGSVRDSLSLFDQAIAHAAGPVRADDVRQMLGLADRTRVIDLFDALVRGDIASAFREFREQYDIGADPVVVLSRSRRIRQFRHPREDRAGDRRQRRIRRDRAAARARFRGKAFDARAVADVADAAEGHRRGADRDAAGGGRRNGAGAHRLCRRPADAGRSDPDDRPEWRRRHRLRRRGEFRVGTRQRRFVRCPRCSFGPARMRPRCAPAPRRRTRPQMIAPAAPMRRQLRAALRIATFPELVALAGEKRDLLTKAALEADVRLVRIEDGRLEVALERSAARALINDLSRKLEQWTGRRWTVIVSNEAGQPTLRSQNEQAEERARARRARPIRGCRRCWRDFPAPRWSRCAGLPPSRRNPMLAVKTLRTFRRRRSTDRIQEDG